MNKEQQKFASDLNRVVNWIIDNPDTDPNAFEMCKMYLNAADLFCGNLPNGVKDDLVFVDRVRMKDYKERLGLWVEHPLFSLIATLFDNAMEGVVISEDACAKEIICRIAGIFLYIIQQQRIDPDFHYSNQDEFWQLKANIMHCDMEFHKFPQECIEMYTEISRQIGI